MSTITQDVPNFLNGISQQPATLRLPTQGEVQENGLSHIARGLEKRPCTEHVTEVTELSPEQERAADTTKDQSNYSADDGSGNTWKAGTDTYRIALQDMTPGQEVKKFSDFNAEIRNNK